MAMIGGSAVVADNGSETLTGLAGAMYTANKAYLLAQLPTSGPPLFDVGSTTPVQMTLKSGAQGSVETNMLQNLAAQTNAIYPALVTYIQANATAVVSTSLGGLQTSAASGSATTAPATQHTIPIS